MRRDLLIGLAVAALTLGVYWPVHTHDFISYDDPQFITDNDQIRSGLSWQTVEYAFGHAVVGNWHPMTTLSHALDCEFFGVNAGAHHLANAMVHAANAALLFFWLQQMLRGRSLHQSSGPSQAGSIRPVGDLNQVYPTFVSAVVALLFALHPLRVESVAWIAERKDLLSGLFLLITLLMYSRYARIRANNQSVQGRLERAWGFYLAALLFFALGLMSKPMLVTLPFILLLLDYWPLRRLELSDFTIRSAQLRSLLVEKVPFVVLAGADCAITLAVQKSAGAMQVIQGTTLPERLANAAASYVRYLGKLFWPTDLAVVYPHPARHYYLSEQWPAWEICAAALFLVLASVLCLLQLRRRPYLAVGWFWFLGTLVPVIGLVQVGEQAMADRYTYIPMIGPVLALVWWISETGGGGGLASGKSRANIGAVVATCVCAALLCLTRRQLDYWQNTVTLFQHAVAVTADNPSAQFALGVGLEQQGEFAKAMVQYRVAIAIDPRYAKAHYNLGQLLRKEGKWQAAADAYLRAARWNPTDVPTQLNLASVLSHLGRTREAIEHFEIALRLDPNSIEGLNNLAWLLSTSTNPALRNGHRAVQLAERACSLTGSKTPFVLGTLAAAYAETGRFGDAVLAGEEALARANETGDLAASARNKELLELYRANRPYRE